MAAFQDPFEDSFHRFKQELENHGVDFFTIEEKIEKTAAEPVTSHSVETLKLLQELLKKKRELFNLALRHPKFSAEILKDELQTYLENTEMDPEKCSFEEITVALKGEMNKDKAWPLKNASIVALVIKMIEKQNVLAKRVAYAKPSVDITFDDGPEVPTSEKVIRAKLTSLSTMPVCVEKVLWQSYCYCSLYTSSKSGAVPDISPEELVAHWRQLPELMKSAVDYSILTMSSNVYEDIYAKLRSQRWMEAQVELKKLCDQVTVINIAEAMFLITMSSQASLSGDVVLLSGPTGAGKSTTVHYIAGSVFLPIKVHSKTLEELPFYAEGLTHYRPITTPSSEHLVNFVCSPEVKSETRYVNSALLECTVDDEHKIRFRLVDSPGFGDTRGAELELANLIGVVSALKKAGSARILVLISKPSLGARRGEGLLKLFASLNGILENAEMTLPSIVYGLTQFGSDASELKPLVENLIHNLELSNRFIAPYSWFLNDLLSKFKKGQCYVLDPEAPDPAELLLTLKNIPRISEPSETFSFSDLSPINPVIRQISADRIRIQAALRVIAENPVALDYIYFKLGEIWEIVRTIGGDLLAEPWSGIISDIIQHISDKNNEAVSSLRHALRLPKLTASDLTPFKEASSVVDQLQKKFRGILGQEFVPFPTGDEQLILEGMKLSNEIVEFLKKIKLNSDEDEGEQGGQILSPAFQRQVNNLSALSVGVERLQTAMDSIAGQLRAHFQKMEEQAVVQLSENRAISFVESFSKLKALDLPPELAAVCASAYENLKNKLWLRLCQMIENAKQILPQIFDGWKRGLSDESLQILINDTHFLDELRSGYASTILRDHFPLEKVFGVVNEYTEILVRYFSDILNGARQHLDDDFQEQKLIEIEIPIRCLQKASKIKLLDVTSKFHDAVRLIADYFSRLNNEIRKIIIDLMEDSQTQNDLAGFNGTVLVQKFEDYLIIFMAQSWVDEFVPEIASGRKQLLRSTSNQIVANSRKIENTLNFSEHQLGIRDHSKLVPIFKLVAKFVSVATIALRYFPDLKEHLDNLDNHIKKIVTKGLDSVSDQIPANPFDLNQAQISFLLNVEKEYLDVCDQFNPAKVFLKNHNTTYSELLEKITRLKTDFQTEKSQHEIQVERLEQEIKLVKASIQRLAQDGKFDEIDPLNQKLKGLSQSLEATKTEHQNRVVLLGIDIGKAEALLSQYTELETNNAEPNEALNVLARASDSKPSLLPKATYQCLKSRLKELKIEESEIRGNGGFFNIQNKLLFQCALRYLMTMNTALKDGPLPALFHPHREQLEQTERIFVQFLQNYLQRTSERLSLLFDSMTSPSTALEVREKSTTEFNSCLRELQEIAKNGDLDRFMGLHSPGFSYISFEGWSEKISQQLRALQNKLGGYMNDESLRQTLEIVSCLSSIDFVVEGTSPDFFNLYIQFSDKFKSALTDGFKQVIDQLQNGDYFLALSGISTLLINNRPLVISKLTVYFVSAVNTLFNKIQRHLMTIECDPPRFQVDICSLLNEISNFENYAEFKTFYPLDQLELKKAQLREQLSDKVEEFVSKIERTFNSNQSFEKIDEKIEALKVVIKYIQQAGGLLKESSIAKANQLLDKSGVRFADLIASYRLERSVPSFLLKPPESDWERLSPSQILELQSITTNIFMKYLEQANNPCYFLIVGPQWPVNKTIMQLFPNLEGRSAYFVSTQNFPSQLELFYFSDYYTAIPVRVHPNNCSSEEFLQDLQDFVQIAPQSLEIRGVLSNAQLDRPSLRSHVQRPTLSAIRSDALRICSLIPCVSRLPELVFQIETLKEQWKKETTEASAMLSNLIENQDLASFQQKIVEVMKLGDETAIRSSMALISPKIDQTTSQITNYVHSFQENPLAFSKLIECIAHVEAASRLIESLQSIPTFNSLTQRLRQSIQLFSQYAFEAVRPLANLSATMDLQGIESMGKRFDLFLALMSSPIKIAVKDLSDAFCSSLLMPMAHALLSIEDRAAGFSSCPTAYSLRNQNLLLFAEILSVKKRWQTFIDSLLRFKQRDQNEQILPTEAATACYFQIARWNNAEHHFETVLQKLASLPSQILSMLNTSASTRRNEKDRRDHYNEILGGLEVLLSIGECFKKIGSDQLLNPLLERESIPSIAASPAAIKRHLVDYFDQLFRRATNLLTNPNPPKEELDEFSFQHDELLTLLETPPPPQTNPLREALYNITVEPANIAGLTIAENINTQSMLSILSRISERLEKHMMEGVIANCVAPDKPLVGFVEVQAASETMKQRLMSAMKSANKFRSIRPRIIQIMDQTLDRFKETNADAIRILGAELRRTQSPEAAAILSQFDRFRGELICKFNEKTVAVGVGSSLTLLTNNKANTNFSRTKLENRYERYLAKYNQLVDRYVRNPDPDETVQEIHALLLSEVLALANKCPKPPVPTGPGFISKVKNFLGLKIDNDQAKKPVFGAVPTSFTQSARVNANSNYASSSSSSSSSSSPNTNSPMNWWTPETYTTFIPELVAGIFALWTTNSASFFREATGAERDHYLLQPKPVQVLSIFRMLGIGHEKEMMLPNNLVEIKTGEGKSVTLAVTAATLALIGFDVSVACYSEFLTQRDERSFRSLFTSLGVTDYIHYGTFNKLCEDEINIRGDIRSVVHQLLFPNGTLLSQERPPVPSDRPRILLIDEVDVFFQSDFFGEEYIPAAKISHPSILQLAREIWDQKQLGKQPALAELRRTSVAYADCTAAFPEAMRIIDQALLDMIGSLEDYHNPPYLVESGRIGYVVFDSISFTTAYGYKTMWAYFEACSRHLLSNTERDANVALLIQCGRFSYAEIPRSFRSIMGVSGTLSCLSPVQKEILNYYDIRQFTFAPSMYPPSQMDYQPNNPAHTKIVFREPGDTDETLTEKHFQVIFNEVEEYLKPSADGKAPGAVLLFFEDEQTVQAFKNYDPVKQFDQMRAFSEKDDNELKENWVREATLSGQLSLVPRSLGRGTDFSCDDPLVLERGGVMVIQTFLSKEVSEEIQIKGRTARQGQKGKYRLFLKEPSLEKVGVLPEDLVDMSSTGIKYEVLDTRRTDYFIAEYGSVLQTVQLKKEPHAKAVEFIDSLSRGDSKAAMLFVSFENRSSCKLVGQDHARIVVFVDATGSMGRTLTSAKNCISTTIDLVKQILQEHNIDENFFQIQFVVYRNYNVKKDKIIQFSGWESDSAQLATFLKDIKPEGGIGNEAIELALQHANANFSSELKQVLLIGDAPGNTPEEVVSKRSQNYGEQYWESTQYGPPTNCQAELDKFKVHGVPIHAYWVAPRAEPFFQDLAAQTNGTAAFLDTNSKEGAKVLTECIAKAILSSHRQGDALVTSFNTKFAKLNV